jgi:hypothetical protein
LAGLINAAGRVAVEDAAGGATQQAATWQFHITQPVELYQWKRSPRLLGA